MRSKLGRNDQCWCGSGKKYKHCHLDREKQEPLKLWDAFKKFRQAYSTRTCLAPRSCKAKCSRQISQAHTVPRSGSLSKIARNGHVYSFVLSLENIFKNEGVVIPELVGLSRASTFTGFCKIHDNSIFAPVEKQPFSLMQEQCFLLGYRALAREIFTKQASASFMEVRQEVDRRMPFDNQMLIQFQNCYAKDGLAAGLRDLECYKAIYDQVLLEKTFDRVRAYIIEFNSPPTVMCSGGIFPEQDFEGQNLQDVADTEQIPHFLNFTSFYEGHYGAVVFMWLPESDHTCKRFVNSLARVPDSLLTDTLLRLFFEFCENIHMQPEWWDNLSKDTQRSLTQRLPASANLESDRKAECLTDDGVRFQPWPVLRRRCIGFQL